MAKAKRQRRTSIRTMQADTALQALEDLERAERSNAEPDAPRAEPTDAVAVPAEREEE